MPIKFEDETPTKSSIKFDDDVSKIPTGGPTVPLKGELAGEPKFLEKATQAAMFVPGGALAAGGLKAASAGTRFAPYAGQLAEALIPQTLTGLTKATGAAGAIGAGAEGARALAERRGASPVTQELVEMGTGLGLGGLGYGASKIPGAVKTLTGAPFRQATTGLQTSAQKLAESLAAQERTAGRELYGKQRQAKLGAAGEREAAEAQIPALKQQFGTPQDASVTGRNLMNDIKSRSEVGHQQRKQLAEETYSGAYDAARQKQAQKNFWQTSDSGKGFFDTLADKIRVKDVTPVSSAEETEIKNLVSELKGKITGYQKKTVFDPVQGMIEIQGPPIYAPADIKVVVEKLRQLREAGKGFPEEGFKSIGQRRAIAMAKSLEESIAGWDDGLRKADKLYKTMSERLYPEQTRRGEAVLAKQKYDINQLSADPINAPKQFFQSKQGVDDLTKLLGGDKDKVAQYANQHVVNELSTKKTAKEAESWVLNRKNVDWMSEVPGLRQRAEAYVKNLKTLEEKGAAAGQLEKTMKGAGRRTAQEMSNRIKQLQAEANVFETIDPNKVVAEAQRFVNKLQAEGVATPAQLDKVQKQILEAEKLYKGKERAKRIAYILGTAAGAGFVGRETTRLFQGG
jgi:hypothetical protein